MTAGAFSMMNQPFNMVDYSDPFMVQDSVVMTCLDQSAQFTGSINLDMSDKFSFILSCLTFLIMTIYLLIKIRCEKNLSEKLSRIILVLLGSLFEKGN